jgi:tRNA G26 N,N-dimethylase Trm1
MIDNLTNKIRHQQLCQQESGDTTAKNTVVCICCGVVGYIWQGALHDETVISSACIDNDQQLKVSISN